MNRLTSFILTVVLIGVGVGWLPAGVFLMIVGSLRSDELVLLAGTLMLILIIPAIGALIAALRKLERTINQPKH